MKRFLVFMFIALLIGCGGVLASLGTPDVQTTTWLNIIFEAVDTTTGVGRIPDSVSVITFFGDCPNTGIFQVSSASLDSNWWDSTQTGAGVAGSKIYYFHEVVADIDADSGAGFYTGIINAWFQGYPMPTYFSFNLVDTTAQEYGSLNYFKTKNLPEDPADDSDIDDQLAALPKITADSTWLADTSQYSGDDDSTMAGLSWRTKAIKAKTDNLPTDPADDSDLDAQLSAVQTDLDNPAQYKATDFATSVQGDSVTQAIADANKVNFSDTAAQCDVQSINGNTDAADSVFTMMRWTWTTMWDSLATVGDTLTLLIAFRDSVIGAIADANKTNFKADGFATSTQGDSVVGAITDANKANFQSSGFAVSGDPMTFKADSLKLLMTDVDGIKTKTDNLPTDPADDSDIDVQLSAIQTDLDSPSQYKATGFATSTQGDSVTTAITDVNKDNFKFGMGAGDSVKAYLSEHDSTLLELAAGGASNWTNAQRDSILDAILDLNKPNFRATGFAVAGDPMTLQSDTLKTLMAYADSVILAINDVNKANFKATGYAVAGDPMTFQSDSLKTLIAKADSLIHAIADVNKPNFMATGFATAESVHTAITDVNKVNFKYGGGADSVRAYLAAHDSTLLELASGGSSNWSDAQRDSILNTILDLNKPNFRATGYAVAGDPMTFKADSLNALMADVDAVKTKTDNLPADPADDSDLDAQLNSIATDLNDPDQYKAYVWANVDTTDVDSSDVGVWLVNNTGGAGGSDTTSIKAMMQKNWDPDTDGELSVETSTGADSAVMKQMFKNNWDTDDDGQLLVEIAGAGEDTLDLIFFDGDTTAVEGISIVIYNSTRTAKIVKGEHTDINGYLQVNLDPGTYYVESQRIGVILEDEDTITVPSGGGRDTIWVVAQPAGSPPSANVTRLTGYNRDLGYNKHDRLKIVMRPQHGNLLDTCQNVFIITKEMVAYSDTGFFQIDVPPSKCLLSKDGPVDIDSVLYDFLIFYKYNKEFERRGIFVPDSTGNVQVKDLLD